MLTRWITRCGPRTGASYIDDLWGLALTNLMKLSHYEAEVNSNASLTGRNLEPFKGILAIAAWLEDEGATGLWKRIDDLSVAYQGERQEMESTDMTALVVRAICRCLVPGCEVFSFCEVCEVFLDTNKVFIKTKEITDTAKEIAVEMELGIKEEFISDRRIGWILKKLRFEKGREGGTGRYGWKISQVEMQKLVFAFGLYTPEKTSQNLPTSQPHKRKRKGEV